MKWTQDIKTCLNCNTLFINLPAEYDEDGGYVALKVIPCTRCGKILCASYDFASCDGCGSVLCADCLVPVEDGGESAGLQCCRECAAITCAACRSTERTVRDDTFCRGLKRPVCCEAGTLILEVA